MLELQTGIEEALQRIPRGSKAQVYIPSGYAFGKLGMPPRVPPGRSLKVTLAVYSFTQREETDKEEQNKQEDSTVLPEE